MIYHPLIHQRNNIGDDLSIIGQVFFSHFCLFAIFTMLPTVGSVTNFQISHYLYTILLFPYLMIFKYYTPIPHILLILLFLLLCIPLFPITSTFCQFISQLLFSFFCKLAEVSSFFCTFQFLCASGNASLCQHTTAANLLAATFSACKHMYST